MPRPLAAWMNGHRYSFGGAESSARKNTLEILPPDNFNYPRNAPSACCGDSEADVFTELTQTELFLLPLPR